MAPGGPAAIRRLGAGEANHQREPYDPHYHGALSVYLGTPEVRYVLINPSTRTYTEGKLPRGELREGIVALLGTEDNTKAEMDDDDLLTIMALHDLYVARTPAPDGAYFWYRPEHTERATRYAGRAWVIAHSRNRDRAVSCRIAQESCEWMFSFSEPVPNPENLALKRMIYRRVPRDPRSDVRRTEDMSDE